MQENNAPKLRIFFNTLECLNLDEIIPKAKSLGIESITIFGNLGWSEAPDYLKLIAKEFRDVRVNLIHDPAYRNDPDWEARLEEDAWRIIPELAALGINDYLWMIECNAAYGQKWHPIWGKYIHRDKLSKNFNYFYDVAHRVNPRSNVIIAVYPHFLLNLNMGFGGWKDWWIKKGEKLKFDSVALDAHFGVWIYALDDKAVYKGLVEAVRFLQSRGKDVSSVEVGYPTCGFKPFFGLYGWGREIDQRRLLEISYKALTDCGVNYMQICEFIDPDPRKQVYEKFFVEAGKLVSVLGVPIIEEANWGILRSDGTEKKACDWVRSVTSS